MKTRTPQVEARVQERLQSIAVAKGRLAEFDQNSFAQMGLSHAQVQERRDLALHNEVDQSSSRSVAQIMRSNLVTLFNIVLGACLVVVLIVGNWRDALFGFIVIANAAIGIVQEYRAKRTLDKLAILHAPQARVRRAGVVSDIDVAQVLYQDALVLRAGDQIPADAQVISVAGLDVDESLLTGESDPVSKQAGDEVYAGSAVVAGSALAMVNRIGPESFSAKLTAEAKRFSLVNSEIRNSINKIVVYITWALVPIILLVLNSQMLDQGGWVYAFENNHWKQAVVAAVAAVVAMIPEGLVLLTSISFGLAAVTLARRQVLVQELPAVESLARVDVICLDKTGTLTEGEIVHDATEVLIDAASVEEALGWFGHDENANATTASLKTRYVAPQRAVEATVPFNSARKYSAVQIAGTSWVLGAPEMVLDPLEAAHSEALERAGALAHQGLRALVLAQSGRPLPQQEQSGSLPAHLEAAALITFREKVRSDAAETLEFFREQNVSLRVISGDNPATVAAVAREVGFADDVRGLDARELPEDLDELADVLDREHVLGRVTPEQKKAIVKALQKRGHVVAMTGDGVNDALALKHADLGIAMGSGAAATKAVSRLVLLDGQFSRMPGVLAQGRRVIANVERVANLFLTKTAMAIILSLVVGILAWRYPFVPRQLSISSALTIGIPAFFLALLPNKRRYQAGFLKRVLTFTIPAGAILASSIVVVYKLAEAISVGDADAKASAASASASLTVLLVSLYVLSVLARPFDRWRVLIVVAMLALTVLAFVVPLTQQFFLLRIPSGSTLFVTIGVVLVAAALVECWYRVLKQRGAVSERE